MCFKTHFANSKSPRKIILEKNISLILNLSDFKRFWHKKSAFHNVIFVKNQYFWPKTRFIIVPLVILSTKISDFWNFWTKKTRKEPKCPKFFVNSKIMTFVNLRKEIGRSIIDQIGHLLIKLGHFRSKFTFTMNRVTDYGLDFRCIRYFDEKIMHSDVNFDEKHELS